MVELM